MNPNDEIGVYQSGSRCEPSGRGWVHQASRPFGCEAFVRGHDNQFSCGLHYFPRASTVFELNEGNVRIPLAHEKTGLTTRSRLHIVLVNRSALDSYYAQDDRAQPNSHL